MDQTTKKDNRHRISLRLFIGALVLLLCLLSLWIFVIGPPMHQPSSSFEESQENLSHQMAKDAYDELLNATKSERSILYSDNLQGRIVWNEAQFLESLVNMYKGTGDLKYLSIFCEHADHILQGRDDHASRPDYAGMLRPGWQTGAYYTLGIPVTVPDDLGNPTLEVQGIHIDGNNCTVVEIHADDAEHFSIVVSNDFRRDKPLVVKFEGLTIETAEKIVNADLSPDSLVRVHVVGSRSPIPGTWPLNETYQMIIHEPHTPIIGVPFLRFADLVFSEDRLASYRDKADEYVSAFEESANDYLNRSYRYDEDGGFFVFEPDGRFWASGLAVPNSGLSANGRFFLWLYRTTGDMRYLELASALAKKVRTSMVFSLDGNMTMPYWPRDSLQNTGWKNQTSDPINGLYSQSAPKNGTEDVSHFSQTLRFMVEAWQMGVVFQDADLKAVAQTFSDRLWKPSSTEDVKICEPDWRRGFYLAHNLDGKGRAYDYSISSFALLSHWDPSILRRAETVYGTRYKDADCLDIDYLYGEVMLGLSILALNGEPFAVEFKEKPPLPFTSGGGAEAYANSSKLFSLDENGTFVTDYGSSYGGAGRRFNPTFTATYALALYRDSLDANDSAKSEALDKQAQWLLNHRTERLYRDLDFWVWEFDFDNPKFGAKAPWVSALSQGRVLCVFLAAYDLTKNPEYYRAAECTFRSFLVPVSAGGVTTFEDNVAWYEEVANEVAPSSKILNGHISATQAIWTFWKWTGREDAKRYLDLGIAAVKRDLALYDTGFLSYYSQFPTSPRIYALKSGYNVLHVRQLLWLYDATADPVFLEYALRFAGYDSSVWNITTAGSTDPINHGPENLSFQMGGKYWSHNKFPTWVQLDLRESQVIDGIVFFGYTNRTTPRDFQVLVSDDGKKWSIISERTGNKEQYYVERFRPLQTRFIRLVILNDNGNNNTALTCVDVLREMVAPAAVSNWESFSSRSLPAHVFDVGWRSPENGWIVVDLAKTGQDVEVEMIGAGCKCPVILGTNDLRNFTALVLPTVHNTKSGLKIVLPSLSSRYLRIEFHDECKKGRLRIKIL